MSDRLGDHFDRVLLSSPLVLGVLAATWLLIVVLSYVLLPTALAGSAMALSATMVMAGALLAGNVNRLRDIRRRQGNLLRHGEAASMSRAQLPPRAVIEQRLQAAGIGVVFGAAGVVATMVALFIDAGSTDGMWGVIVGFVALVAAAGSFVAGTFVRPID